MDEFGRGGRWVCECGDFYDALTGCRKCKNSRMMVIMARKQAERKRKGIPNKAAQKRARIATGTKIVNLFKLGNMEKGQKMLDNLKKKSPSRWGRVNRIVKRLGIKN